MESCVPYVTILGGATVTFSSPTILYVTGDDHSGGSIPAGFAFKNHGTVAVASGLETRPNRGLTVVAPAPPAGRWTKLALGIFNGSVYAADSQVIMTTVTSEGGSAYAYGCDSALHPIARTLGYLVARQALITHAPIVFSKTDDKARPPPPSLVSWKN